MVCFKLLRAYGTIVLQFYANISRAKMTSEKLVNFKVLLYTNGKSPQEESSSDRFVWFLPNDIRFEYKPTVDTADGIAQELLSTGANCCFFCENTWVNRVLFSELICDEDVGPMSANLQRIVNNPPPNRVITFRVKTGFEEPNDVLDEPNLTGFAQLSLTD